MDQGSLPQAVKMSYRSWFVLSLCILSEAYFPEQVNTMVSSSCLHKWPADKRHQLLSWTVNGQVTEHHRRSQPIKAIAIVCWYDMRFDLQYMIEKLPDQTWLIWLVEDDKWTFILRFGVVLKILDIIRYYFSISDQITLQYKLNRLRSLTYCCRVKY